MSEMHNTLKTMQPMQTNNTSITYYDIIKSYIIIVYNYIKQLLIIDAYTINDDDELIIQIKYFILRYRRIIGIILLCLLLYINNKCHISNNNNDNENENSNNNDNENENENSNKNGNNRNKKLVGGSDLPPPPLPLKTYRTEVKAKIQSLEDNQTARSFVDAQAKQVSNAAAAQAKQVSNAATAQAKQVSNTAKKASDDAQAQLDKSVKNTGHFKKQGIKFNADASAKLGKIGAKVSTKISVDTDAYKARTGKDYKGSLKQRSGIVANKLYKVGAWTGDKFKDMTSWLYEFLFAMALSIALCAIILPSISFLIIGIICYFLFKKKMILIKSM